MILLLVGAVAILKVNRKSFFFSLGGKVKEKNMQKMCRVECDSKILMVPILIFNIVLNVGLNLIFQSKWRKKLEEVSWKSLGLASGRRTGFKCASF